MQFLFAFIVVIYYDCMIALIDVQLFYYHCNFQSFKQLLLHFYITAPLFGSCNIVTMPAVYKRKQHAFLNYASQQLLQHSECFYSSPDCQFACY